MIPNSNLFPGNGKTKIHILEFDRRPRNFKFLPKFHNRILRISTEPVLIFRTRKIADIKKLCRFNPGIWPNYQCEGRKDVVYRSVFVYTLVQIIFKKVSSKRIRLINAICTSRKFTLTWPWNQRFTWDFLESSFLEAGCQGIENFGENCWF